MRTDKTRVDRRTFVQESAAMIAMLGGSGSIVETAFEPQGQGQGRQRASVATAQEPAAMVKIRGKNFFLPVRAWISDEVVKMVGANNEPKRRALVNRLLHENEEYLDVITKGGTQTGQLRFYIGVDHTVKSGAGEVHDMPDRPANHAANAKCVWNWICITWENSNKECCARWKCCDLV